MPGDRQLMRHQLYQLAADQSGYFTAAQALDIGYSYQAQKYHVDRGNWRRVDRAIFRIPEWPPGPNDGLARWLLWSKGRAVVSHDSAASAYGLGLLNPAKVHLTVPPEFRMSDEHLVLYHRYLPDSDIDVLDGVRITTVLRTVLDVLETQFDDELATSVMRDALDDGRVSRRQLMRRFEELPDEQQVRAVRLLSEVAA